MSSHRAANPLGFCLPVSLFVAPRQVRRTLLPLMDAESLRLFGKRYSTIRCRRTLRRDMYTANREVAILAQDGWQSRCGGATGDNDRTYEPELPVLVGSV